MAKHEVFERDLAAIKEKVEGLSNAPKNLTKSFSDAETRVRSSRETMMDAWHSLLQKSTKHMDQLQESLEAQLYLDEFEDHRTWCNEMLTRVTADELAKDVSGAEDLMKRHKENKAEIDTKNKEISRFIHKGKTLITQQNCMSTEIQSKVNHLNELITVLLETWQQRKVLYDQNLDLERLKQEMAYLDAWMDEKRPFADNDEIGDSIESVEELLKKHNDFEKMVLAQDSRFNAILRLTLLEQAFLEQKKREEQFKLLEENRKEEEIMEKKRKREQERILEERRLEDDRRKTEELRNSKSLNFSQDTETPKTILTSEEVDSIFLRSASIRHSRNQPKARKGGVNEENLPWTQTTIMPGKSVESTGKVDTNTENLSYSATQKTVRDYNLQKKIEEKTPEKKWYKVENSLPPAEVEGFLERKQELQTGGTKVTNRKWKRYYSVLCGQLLCFFKDKKDFLDSTAATAPLPIHGATCESAKDYTKRRNVLRLSLSDGAEYLFMAQSQNEMMSWISKIQFHAALKPYLQLMHYDSHLAQHLHGRTVQQQESDSRSPSDSLSSLESSPTQTTSLDSIKASPHGSSSLNRNSLTPKKSLNFDQNSNEKFTAEESVQGDLRGFDRKTASQHPTAHFTDRVKKSEFVVSSNGQPLAESTIKAAVSSQNRNYARTESSKPAFVVPEHNKLKPQFSDDIQPLNRTTKLNVRPLSDGSATALPPNQDSEKPLATSTTTLNRDTRLVTIEDKEVKKRHSLFGGNLFGKSKKDKDKKK